MLFGNVAEVLGPQLLPPRGLAMPPLPWPNSFWSWGNSNGDSITMPEFTSTATLPDLPFLVVIIITPLAARLPYSADAAGPFNTFIDSMSSGLMLLAPSLPLVAPKSLVAWPCTVLSTGTPSITKRALLLPPIERFPRIITRVAEPGPDAPCVMTIPATLPESVFTKLASRTSVRALPSIFWVEYVSDLADLSIPNAVTTTSLSVRVSAAKSAVMLEVAELKATSLFINPTDESTKVPEAGTLSLNLPSPSVVVPLVLPLSNTFTPGRACCASSRTVPVICRSWASS